MIVNNASRRASIILSIGISLVLIAGIAMRVWGVGAHPYGIYQDEAFYGLDAVEVIQGARPLYFESNNGREPLYIYLLALSISIFGQTALGLRIPAAIIGVLTLGAAYLLGRGWRDHRTGLITAGIFAVTLWPIHLSHVSFRAGMLPLLMGLALGAGGLALQKQSRRLAIAAGVLYGIGFYTYLAVRFTPLALIGMAVYGWIWHRDWVRERWRLIAWMIGAAFVVALPLGIFTLLNFELVMGRSGQVAIWNRPDAVPILSRNVINTLGMFTWRGDWIWRHNVPNRPVFDLLIGIPFVMGIIYGALHWRKVPALALSLIWIGVMVIPTLLADDAPHFLRSVGVLPVAMLIPAVMLDQGLEWVSKQRIPVWVGSAGVVLVLAISGALTARDYFGCRPATMLRLSGYDYAGCYAVDPVRGYFFQAQATDLAQAINESPGTVYLDQRYWDTFPSIRYLVTDTDRLEFYTEGDQLRAADLSFTLFAWPHDGLEAAVGTLPQNAQIEITVGPETRGDQEPEPYVLYISYQVQTAPSELHIPLATFENGLTLLDARIIDGVLTLKWQSDQPQTQPVTLFVHSLDQSNNIIAQLDEPPGTVYYPPLLWSRGSVIIHRAVLEINPAVAFRIGIYDPATGNRIPIIESSAQLQDNALIIPINSAP